MNRLAYTLSQRLPGRDVVISSVMEHHSNDLPHRKHFREVIHVPCSMVGPATGAVDVAAIERALKTYSGRVAYVSVTGVSNVTGIVNPIHDIAAVAHAHGASVIVDGAQMVGHLPVIMSGNSNPARDIDALVFSGHKIYAPGSPGVVVVRKTLFEGGVPLEVGGGMVDDVWVDRYSPTAALPDREEAGTPNIVGAIGLAAALYALDKAGMEAVQAKETALMCHAIECLKALDDVVIYGDIDTMRTQRAGAISFNVRGMHHALAAAILNDYFNIAVRNQCFCAHPYVREMIMESLAAEDDGTLSNEQLEEFAEMQRGMVRASFGIYTSAADIDALGAALTEITANQERFKVNYERLPSGDFRHHSFCFEPRNWFSVRDTVEACLQ
jgi:selenocysteine lyase/cysteine desulfurase